MAPPDPFQQLVTNLANLLACAPSPAIIEKEVRTLKVRADLTVLQSHRAGILVELADALRIDYQTLVLLAASPDQKASVRSELARLGWVQGPPR